MAQDRIKGEIVFYCDGADCDETLETGEGGFEEANDVRRDSGWFANRKGGEWLHYCGRSCQLIAHQKEFD